MAEFLLKYADPRGEMHQQSAEAGSEQELRERYTKQGFVVYSVKPKGTVAALTGSRPKGKKVSLEKFLIFNQQFVTLIRAGLPILKSLDLLAERLTDPKMQPFIRAVREEVKNGALLSDAFARQGVFPSIYVSSVLAGEKSGSLVEVLDRYIHYQRLTLAVRKRIIVALIYPSLLLVLVSALVVFLITYVVPNFAQLYQTMSARLPAPTRALIALSDVVRGYLPVILAVVVGGGAAYYFWSRTTAAKETIDRIKLRTPVLGEIWIKFQVAQFSRVLGTLLVGGIPLVNALETAADSLGTPLLTKALEKVRRLVREGQPLSASLKTTGVFPELSIDMMEVGESTGALPAMLGSVAEFYEDDVNTRMTAALSLIEPAIMIFMGAFVAFVLISLYLPIFSLADSLG